MFRDGRLRDGPNSTAGSGGWDELIPRKHEKSGGGWEKKRPNVCFCLTRRRGCLRVLGGYGIEREWERVSERARTYVAKCYVQTTIVVSGRKEKRVVEERRKGTKGGRGADVWWGLPRAASVSWFQEM